MGGIAEVPSSGLTRGSWRGFSVLLVALVIALLTTTSASAKIHSLEIQEYRHDFGVSAASAEASLDSQEQAAEEEIVGDLEGSLGGQYAGVWFDNESGEFVVPMLPGADRSSVGMEFADAGMRGEFRTAPAQSSWQDLGAAQGRIDRKLLPLIDAGRVSTWTDPRTNAVVVEAAPDVEAAVSALTKGAAQGVAVEMREGKDDMRPQTVGCNISIHACPHPLRGGVAMDTSPNTLCTAGFKALGKTTGQRFVLTAGHCNTGQSPWDAVDAETGKTQTIGTMQTAIFPEHDWGAINASGGAWDDNPWPSQISAWGVDEQRAINAESTSYLGEYVCHVGVATNTNCGNVRAVNRTVNYQQGTVYHLSEAGPICVWNGDSGGPVFIGNTALGITSGKEPDNAYKTEQEEYEHRCSFGLLYTEVTEATSALGVTVTTPAKVPPNHDDNSPGPHAIDDPTNGAVHVFYRTPSGGLGHDWHVPWESVWGVETLGGSVASEPHAYVSSDGEINVFYRTASGGLGHDWWEPGNTVWGVETLGGQVASEPHAIIDPTNEVVHVFYRTPSGGLGHDWHAPWESVWGVETLGGSVASEPQAYVSNEGEIDVFYRTPSGGLGHDWWEPGNTVWGVETLGGQVASEPHAVYNPTNEVVHVFYRTPSGALGHDWHEPWNPVWGVETLGGSVASEPQAYASHEGEIDVFYRTPSGGLGHDWSEPGNPVWGVETLGGSVASEPHAVYDPTNEVVHVFYRTPSGGLGHDWHAPWESVWGVETLGGSLASEPHVYASNEGELDVFYRTPSGALGHDWWEPGNTVWGVETLGGSIAARPPAVTTGAASSIGFNEAKTEGTINPEGSPTTCYFEYGTTTSYGSKKPTSGKEIGYGRENVAFSETLTGLSPSTTYHYRVAATSPEGTTYGEDKTFTTAAEPSGTATELAAMTVTEPFNGSSESLANFGSKWSTLGWAGGTTPKGVDTSTGWGPSDAYSTVNGASYNPAFSDTGPGLAAVATMAVRPGNVNRYFSLWLDMPTPTGAKAGYELRFTYTATDTYEVKLSKWVGGTQTVLASKTGYSFAAGKSLAIVDQASTVSAWTNTGSGFVQLLSATDSAFSSGSAGLEGSGNFTRLTNFKAGPLLDTASRLAAISVTEPFNGSSESLANFGSKWSALGWDGGSVPKGQDTSTGWGPYAAYSTVNGASYNPAFSDTGPGLAAVATMAANPANTSRYFSLWLDMPTPTGTKAGYELHFTETATNTYEVKLSKWQGGTQTVLATKAGYSFLNGNSLAIVDQGSTVSAWVNTGSGFVQLLSASDSTFSSGNAGLEGSGNITRLTNFKAGSLL